MVLLQGGNGQKKKKAQASIIFFCSKKESTQTFDGSCSRKRESLRERERDVENSPIWGGLLTPNSTSFLIKKQR